MTAFTVETDASVQEQLTDAYQRINQTGRVWMFDTETTGINPQGDENEPADRLLEFGAIEVVSGVPTGKSLHLFMDPCRDVPDEVVKIHGMDRAKARELSRGCGENNNIKVFADFIEDFQSLAGETLVAHNAPFDIAFMDAEFARMGLEPFSKTVKVIDTLAISRVNDNLKSHKLDSLAAYFKVDNSERESSGLHGALIDCRLLMGVFNAMVKTKSYKRHQIATRHYEEKLRPQQVPERIAEQLVAIAQNPQAQEAEQAMRDRLGF